MICIRTGSAVELYREDTGRLSVCTMIRRDLNWTIEELPGYYTDSFFHKYFKVLKER